MPVPPIPWDQILIHGPKILDAAKTMWNRSDDRPRPEPVDPNTEVKTQIAMLEKRLRTLEDMEKSQAELVKNMAEQMQLMSRGLSELSQAQTGLADTLAELRKSSAAQAEALAADQSQARRRNDGRIALALWLSAGALALSAGALLTVLLR